MSQTVDDATLEYLRDTRSLDFTDYKRPSLTRRILKRAHADVGASVTFNDVTELARVRLDLEATEGE